jgi:hypothetical protein
LRFAAMKIIAQSLGKPVCLFLLGLFCGGFAGLLITTHDWRSYLNFLSSTIILLAVINSGKQLADRISILPKSPKSRPVLPCHNPPIS